jgi:hypothetical protein
MTRPESNDVVVREMPYHGWDASHSRPAPELGFVSANNWDGFAAVSAGLRTFWIQRSAAEVPEELGFQVDITVKAITDLPALLRG